MRISQVEIVENSEDHSHQILEKRAKSRLFLFVIFLMTRILLVNAAGRS